MRLLPLVLIIFHTGAFFNFYNLFLLYVHWCFACVYICIEVSENLELELQISVSCNVGAGN